MSVIYDNSITNCFVAPFLCKHLVDVGLSANVMYQWKVRGDDAGLSTHEFDIDDYYKDGVAANDAINPPDLVLPAYNLKEVEKLLPTGYLLTLNHNGQYEVSLSDIYQGESCCAGRMPDAFALLLLQSIKTHVVDLKKINSMLSQ